MCIYQPAWMDIIGKPGNYLVGSKYTSLLWTKSMIFVIYCQWNVCGPLGSWGTNLFKSVPVVASFVVPHLLLVPIMKQLENIVR